MDLIISWGCDECCCDSVVLDRESLESNSWLRRSDTKLGNDIFEVEGWTNSIPHDNLGDKHLSIKAHCVYFFVNLDDIFLGTRDNSLSIYSREIEPDDTSYNDEKKNSTRIPDKEARLDKRSLIIFLHKKRLLIRYDEYTMSSEKMQKNSHKILIRDEKSLDNYLFPLLPWDKIFFYGDLWAGKSTFIRHLLRKHFDNPELVVRSPTYTYYQKYEVNNQKPRTKNLEPRTIYHFDLYRIEDISTFYSIGWMEILEHSDTIALIEWPELIEDFVTPTKKISIQLLENGEREIVIE